MLLVMVSFKHAQAAHSSNYGKFEDGNEMFFTEFNECVYFIISTKSRSD